MRFVGWLFWACLFALFFWVALKNADPVVLRLTAQNTVAAPLVIVMLAAFTTGLLVGLVASASRLFRQGREIKRLKGTVEAQAQQLNLASITPRAPDVPST
jgi:lipopolysaccharide assembly protein A